MVLTYGGCYENNTSKQRNGIQSHSLTLAESLWRPNSGCEVVGDVFQQWQQ